MDQDVGCFLRAGVQSSLVSPRLAGLDGQDGHPPDLAELFTSGLTLRAGVWTV